MNLFFQVSADRDWQIWAFKELLGWAVEAEKPLIIHGRAAYEDVLKIYDEEMRSVSAKPGGVIHCFDGDFETALEFIDRGFYLEIGGQVTKLPALQETVARLPLERIVYIPVKDKNGNKISFDDWLEEGLYRGAIVKAKIRQTEGAVYPVCLVVIEDGEEFDPFEDM